MKRFKTDLLGLKRNDLIGEWKIIGKIGGGGCGNVYEAVSINEEKDNLTSKRCAIKIEARLWSDRLQLLRSEAIVLQRLNNSDLIPKMFNSGRTRILNFIAMELLGKSLNEMLKSTPERKIPIPSVLKIGIQMLAAIRELHNAYFLHRDIKPANFAIGLNNPNRVYMFDFGLVRQFVVYDEARRKIKLRKPRKRVGFRGTVAYCSLNVHKKIEQGRHDDLWSMMFILIEFASGKLPWKGCKQDQTAILKQEISRERLLQGCPKQFAIILDYLDRLSYRIRPDYDFINDLLTKTLIKHDSNMNSIIEWHPSGKK